MCQKKRLSRYPAVPDKRPNEQIMNKPNIKVVRGPIKLPEPMN